MNPVSGLGAVVSQLSTHRLLTGVLLLPAFLGSLIVWSLGDRAEEVDRVPAAVVNLDEPVLRKGEQPVAAGRLLAAGLTQPTEEQQRSLGWELTDADDARRGLREGDYYAVLTIPKDFSRTITRSLEGKNPQKAQITVTTEDAGSELVAEVSAQVGAVAADELGTEVTRRYLDTVFTETGKLGKKLGQAADGAKRLADGTQRLGSGTDHLADGLDELSDGATRLAGGADQLASGAGRLERGTEKLAGGADELATGLGTLDRRTDALPKQTDRLADGAADIERGVEGYSKLLEAWDQACADPIIAARAGRLCVETKRAVGPTGERAQEFRQGARKLADGARQLADGMPRLESGIDEAADGSRRLADGADRLVTGAGRLSSGAQELASGAERLAAGADQASSGATEIAAGSERLDSGSRELADGLDRGAEQIPTYGEQERKDLADVVAAPVAATTDERGADVDGPTQLAPATIAFALWLGAFVTYLVRPALPSRLLGRPMAASRLGWSGLLPGVAIGAAQALLLYLSLLVLGADLASPVATLVVMLAASAGFAALHQAFVAVLGRARGWLLSIALAGLQAVALGGILPLDTAPQPLPLLGTLLPMNAVADALVATVPGGPGSVVGGLALVLLWGAAAYAVTVGAARRAQRVDVDDLRYPEEERQPVSG